MANKPSELYVSQYNDKSDSGGLIFGTRRKNLPIWPTRRLTLQSYICITLGLENILRLSVAIIHHGGILWVPYFLCAILVGVPFITAEIALAHYIDSDLLQLWKMCPVAKGVFFNILIATFIATAMNHINLTYILDYSFGSHILTMSSVNSLGKLMTEPWYNSTIPGSSANATVNAHREHNNPEHVAPLLDEDEEYLKSVVAEKDWLLFLYLAIICFVIILINSKGIRSLVKFTTPLIIVYYLSAAIFLILTLSLPGSPTYIRKSWTLEWHRLKDISVWLGPFEHVVIGFVIGNLCLSFVSVHSDFRDDIMVDVVIIFLTDFLSTLLFSLTVLGILGHLSHENEATEQILSDEYLLVIVRIFDGLQYLPPPKKLWIFIFFIYLTVSAINLQSFMVASLADAFITIFPRFKTNLFYVNCGLGAIFFITAIPPLALKVVNLPPIQISFIITGLLESITLFWIYNYQRVCADFHFLMGYKPSLFYQFTWAISPTVFLMVLILHTILQSTGPIVSYPLIVMAFHLCIFLLCAIIEVTSLWKKGENINIFRSDKDWGPTDPLLKKSRHIFKSRVITEEHIYRQNLYKKQLIKPFNIEDQNIVNLL